MASVERKNEISQNIKTWFDLPLKVFPRLESHLIAILVVQSIVISCGVAVSPSEIAALNEIYSAYPDLTSVASWEQLTDDGVNYGRSWTEEFATICDTDGYTMFGVYCQSGSVIGLRITPSWGVPLSSSFTTLPHLQNLTVEATSAEFCEHLVNTLVLSNVLTHIRVPGIASLALPLSSDLQTISITSSIPFILDIASYSHLRRLEVTRSPSDPPLDLSSGHPSLAQLHLVGAFETHDVVSSLTNFPSLESLHCACTSTVYPINIDSTTLRSVSFPSPDANVIITVNGTNLERFEVNKAKVTLGNVPALKYVEFGSLEIGLYPVPTTLKSMKITKNLVPGVLESFCPWVDASVSTLESLTILSVLSSTTIPQCFFQPEWKEFGITGVPLNHTLVLTLPTSITKLSLNSQAGSAFNFTDFYRLSNLQSLSIVSNYLSGTIPQDFFQNLANLRYALFNSGNMVGSIPSVGWSGLESIFLKGSLTRWDGIDSANNLRSLSLSSSLLESIPTDNMFVRANLQKINSFLLYASSVQGHVPAFWANSPTIGYVDMSANFSGPLPDMNCPRLSHLNIISEQVCGALPKINVPIQLRRLGLSNNKISGTIPTSWEDNLTLFGLVNMQNTRLSGTLPQGLFNHHGLRFRTVNFANTSLEGSLWNMSRGAPSTIDFSNTNFNLSCLPHDTPNNITTATFNNIKACPTGPCLASWQAVESFSCTTNSGLISPPLESCIVQTLACSLPAPPAPFLCLDGQWVAGESITTPIISLPPNLGTIVVVGDLSSSTISFSGTSTTLQVSGCVEGLQQVLIDVDPDNPPTKTVLIEQNGNCLQPLSSVDVELKKTKKSCKEVGASKDGSTLSTLSVTFLSKNGKCNTKWIILGSVLGGVLIIVVISLILLERFNKSFRHLVRPSGKRKGASTA